jgi:hypothetical protein
MPFGIKVFLVEHNSSIIISVFLFMAICLKIRSGYVLLFMFPLILLRD